MTSPDSSSDWQPRYPLLIAIAIFVLGSLALCWPMLQGQLVGGDDQIIAGYAFRLFGSDYFKQYGSIPQWNPYLFGGLPFSSVIGHGDIFYPTAWLRWFVPVDIGMSFGFFFHIALAGVSMYALVRGLRMSWTAAVVAGIAYQLSGNVSSMLNNGHDGKLFVCALAPFALLALLRAIRHNQRGSYGVLALVIGLAILSPQVQMAYYLMVASGLFALWLVFFDPERRAGMNPWITLAAAFGAVAIGVGISMIQIYPILTHVKYTPRAGGGPSTGWEYAIQYGMPPRELITVVLPQFFGMDRHYIGGNPVKSHTEYLGVITVILAILGVTAARQRKLLLPFAAIGGLFMLVSFSGDTPFYRLWYTLMPMMDKVRAAGMAFYMVGLCTAVLAAMGIERLRRGEVASRTLFIILGVFGAFALLGAAGALQPISAALANPGRGPAIAANASELQIGSFRLLLFVALGGAALFYLNKGILRGVGAAAALALLVGADSWSILKHFAPWVPPASETYADDQVITEVKKLATMPYRLYQPSGDQIGGAGVYQASTLMAHHVPTLFGYHGMESVYFDSLLGSKNLWSQQLNPVLWDLYGVNYIAANQEIPAEQLPGYHKVLGPVPSQYSHGTGSAFLFQRDTAAPWVRVVPRGIKVPQAQLLPTLLDPTFPYRDFLLFSDTSVAEGATTSTERPGPSPIRASLAEWKPGAMTVRLEGSDSVVNWLLVAENWYPDWHATVDGSPAPTVRADHALLGVAIPPGAKEIGLVFDVPEYHAGMWISLVCTLIALAVIGTAGLGRRMANG